MPWLEHGRIPDRKLSLMGLDGYVPVVPCGCHALLVHAVANWAPTRSSLPVLSTRTACWLRRCRPLTASNCLWHTQMLYRRHAASPRHPWPHDNLAEGRVPVLDPSVCVQVDMYMYMLRVRVLRPYSSFNTPRIPLSSPSV